MRMKSRIKSTVMGIALIIPGAAVAQENPGTPPELTVKPVGGGAYEVLGGRANTGFIIGSTGVIVIDAQMSRDAAQQELAAIGKLTSKPVTTLILTHADPDHAGGVPFYPTGTKVIEQENAWSEEVASANDPAAGPLGPVYKQVVAHKPWKTIGSTEALTIDGVRMELAYVAPAHTSGDLIVYLPADRVVYAGDVITTNLGRYPVIHLGGSSLGWIATMKAILALNATTYVGGHGAIETRAQLQTRVRDAEERRAAVKALVEQGKTAAEVEAALPDSGASPMFLTFTRTVYDELTKGYPVANPPWLNLVHR